MVLQPSHVITRDDDHREKKVTTWNVLVSSNLIVQQHGYNLDWQSSRQLCCACTVMTQDVIGLVGYLL